LRKTSRSITSPSSSSKTALIGALCALDLVLFYIFWELMLVPMYS